MRCGRSSVDLHFRIHDADVEIAFKPLDFIQVNAGMNQRMIARTLDLLDARADDSVLDLFCGLGNFTLPIARRVGTVVGVEGERGWSRVPARMPRETASPMRISMRRICSIRPCATQRGPRRDYDKLLLDPPRSGAAAVLEYLPRKGTDRVVYVSCHPGSLARDAGTLVNAHGFTLRRPASWTCFRIPHMSSRLRCSSVERPVGCDGSFVALPTTRIR